MFCKRHSNSKSGGCGGKTQENVLPLCTETNSCRFTPLGDELCIWSQFPPLFQARRYLLSVCNMLSGTLRITSIHFTKKKKEPMLPACHQLAKTHHVNFMTTACYYCQFFHFNSDSLGHPHKLLAFIFYGFVCFCLILTVPMKDLRRRFILWV